jgi:hypothetical protein
MRRLPEKISGRKSALKKSSLSFCTQKSRPVIPHSTKKATLTFRRSKKANHLNHRVLLSTP